VRLFSCRTDSGETLGVMAGERWIAAVELVPDGPATMADLLNDGAAAMTRVREAAVPERIGRLENRCVFETAGGPA